MRKSSIGIMFLMMVLSTAIPVDATSYCQPATRCIPVWVRVNVYKKNLGGGHYQITGQITLSTYNTVFTPARIFPSRAYRWTLYKDGVKIKSGVGYLQLGWNGFYKVKSIGMLSMSIKGSGIYKLSVEFRHRNTFCSPDAHYMLPKTGSRRFVI